MKHTKPFLTRARVALGIVELNPGIQTPDVAKALKVSKSAALTSLRHLKKSGSVEARRPKGRLLGNANRWYKADSNGAATGELCTGMDDRGMQLWKPCPDLAACRAALEVA